MISNKMRFYDYYLMEKDDYAQEVVGENVIGSVKMAIFETSKTVQDDIRYEDATYLGLTPAIVDDTFVIKYGNEKLKVLYVYPKGRLKQVFLKVL